MSIDENKVYNAYLTSVKCNHRPRFGTRCLQLFFDIKELGESTKRTVEIPKTLKPTSSKFTEVLGPILDKEYPDQLLARPDELAKVLDRDLSNKVYGAYLKKSSNGKYLDIETLHKFDESFIGSRVEHVQTCD